MDRVMRAWGQATHARVWLAASCSDHMELSGRQPAMPPAANAPRLQVAHGFSSTMLLVRGSSHGSIHPQQHTNQTHLHVAHVLLQQRGVVHQVLVRLRKVLRHLRGTEGDPGNAATVRYWVLCWGGREPALPTALVVRGPSSCENTLPSRHSRATRPWGCGCPPPHPRPAERSRWAK